MSSTPASAPVGHHQQLLRWAFVLPAAALSAYVAHIIGGVIIQIFATGWNIPSELGFIYWLKFAMYYLPKKAAFVLGGALTAPSHRLLAALFLALLAAFTSLTIHILSQRGHIGRANYIHLSAELSGILLGLLCMALIEMQKSRHPSQNASP